MEIFFFDLLVAEAEDFMDVSSRFFNPWVDRLIRRALFSLMLITRLCVC